MTNEFLSIGKRGAVIILTAAIVTGIIVWTVLGWRPHASPPEIKFLLLEDSSIKDPDNPTKEFRFDFARVEEEAPLSRADLMKITPENVAVLKPEEIDQIYGRITAGPIPNGPYEGNLFFAKGDNQPNRLEEIIGGIEGRVAKDKIDLLENIGRTLWKGKKFYREDRVLRNFIEDLAPLRALIDNPSTLMTATVPRRGILSLIMPTNQVWLLFPAKLYCGQSLLDSRRESVIIDYGYGDEIKGYQGSPDSLAGRNGLKVRDEIRMIRPGFYLGRAYTNRMFLLYFTLYNSEIAERESASFAAGGAIAEDCWPGEQVRKAAGR
jgi:hypothetical protein